MDGLIDFTQARVKVFLLRNFAYKPDADATAQAEQSDDQQMLRLVQFIKQKVSSESVFVLFVNERCSLVEKP